jgi:hypothetical protein
VSVLYNKWGFLRYGVTSAFSLIKRVPWSKTFEQHWTVPVYTPAQLQTKEAKLKYNGITKPKYSKNKNIIT